MKLPYGYVLIDGTITVHEEKADIVRGIFDDYLAGASLGKIVDLLFKRGVASPTGKAKWTRAAVDKLLANKKYILGRQSHTDLLHFWPDETIQSPFLLLYL